MNDIPGEVAQGRVYTIAELRARLRLGDKSWREMKGQGLRIIRKGNGLVLSDDVLTLLAKEVEKTDG